MPLQPTPPSPERDRRGPVVAAPIAPASPVRRPDVPASGPKVGDLDNRSGEGPDPLELEQYGMRSTKAAGAGHETRDSNSIGEHAASESGDEAPPETFDSEYRIREQRNHRERTIPTGVLDKPDLAK